MADFTRFDFHAKRFYFSENVRLMSAEEVGQYLLLLVEAWMSGKDASLPDNAELLARYARVQKVSERVLDMFPVVDTEHGKRRRNETLFEEWQSAVQRSEAAREKVSKRTDRQPVPTAVQPQYNSGEDDRNTPVLLISKPNQAVSGSAQTGSQPSQPDQETRGGFGSESSGAAAPDPAPDFKTFKTKWNNTVKYKGMHWEIGHSKSTVNTYNALCEKYGADTVLEAITVWATDQYLAFMASKNFNNPFGSFIKHLPEVVEKLHADISHDPEMIAADKVTDQLPPVVADKSVVNDILKIASEEQAARDARAEKFSKQNTSQGTLADYL